MTDNARLLDWPYADWDIPATTAYETLTGRTVRDWADEPGEVRNKWRLAIHCALTAETRRLRSQLDVCRGCGEMWPGSLAPEGLCPSCYPHTRPLSECQCPWCATDDEPATAARS